MTFLQQHHDADRDDRFGHGEDAEDRILRHRRGAAGLCLPSASNQPIWPRRGHHHGHAGDGPLVDVALERIRHPLQSDRREAEQFRFGLGSGGVCGAAACLAAVCGGHGLSRLLLLLSGWVVGRSLAQNGWVEQGVCRGIGRLPQRCGLCAMAGETKHSSCALVNRFALAIGALPMLETARIGGDAGSLQGCSSVGRVPVSKTGCRRFEPCHPCQ